MNPISKIIIAILGAINIIFGIFIPIAVALIIVKLYPPVFFFGFSSQWVVILAGSLSSFYKAIDIAFLKE